MYIYKITESYSESVKTKSFKEGRIKKNLLFK